MISAPLAFLDTLIKMHEESILNEEEEAAICFTHQCKDTCYNQELRMTGSLLQLD
jgi:hypothetical protein